MRRMYVVGFALLVVSTAGSRNLQAQDSIPAKFITFEDMRPPEVTCMSMGYGTLGLDPNDNVYCAWCGDCSGPGNCAMFQYNPETGQRKLLGTLREVAKAAGNLGPNQTWNRTEIFMKGHTHLPYLKGKIYIGTQEFHGVSNALNRASNQVNYRGAHIFAYDIANGKLEDISVSQPNGVFSPHQGILQLMGYPEKNLLVAWAIPAGDLIIYDVDSKATYTNPGVASEFGKDVTREIPITSKGKVFYNYQFGGLYLYDIAAKTNTKLDFSIPTANYGGCSGDMQGLINGAVTLHDRSKIYFATFGYLYVLDSETEKITFLTRQLPSTENLTICRVWGLSFSLDQKKIYWVVTTGSAAFRLYEYDIATNKVVFLKDLSSLIGKSRTYSGRPGQLSEISGDDVTDSKGRIYFVRHTYDNAGGSGLLQIDVSSRSGPAPTGTRTATGTSTTTRTGTATATPTATATTTGTATATPTATATATATGTATATATGTATATATGTATATATGTATGTSIGAEPRADAGLVVGRDAAPSIADAVASDGVGRRDGPLGTATATDTATALPKSDAPVSTGFADSGSSLTDTKTAKTDAAGGGAPAGGDKPGSSGCGCTLGGASPKASWGLYLVVVALFVLRGRSRVRETPLSKER